MATTTTRAAIRRRAVHLARTRGVSSADGVTALTATGGSASTLIDTDFLPPPPAVANLYKKQWIYTPTLAAADQQRIVKDASGYSASTQTITIESGLDWSTGPVSATPYLILEDKPDTWDSAINEALRELLAFPRFDEFSPVSNSRRIYDISSAPISVTDLDRLSQIWAVQWHDEDDATNEERWKDWDDGFRTVRPFEDAGDFFLRFGAEGEVNPLLPSKADQFRLVTTQPYATLSDETTTSNVEETWAAYATLVVMADWLGDHDNPADEWTEIGAKYGPIYEDRRRAVLGEFAFHRVWRSQTQRGGSSVAGRAGRGRGGALSVGRRR